MKVYVCAEVINVYHELNILLFASPTLILLMVQSISRNHARAQSVPTTISTKTLPFMQKVRYFGGIILLELA